MDEKEIREGVIISNLTSNRIIGKLSSGIDKFLDFEELPPHIIPDAKNISYKHLGDEKTLGGENLFKFSVRKRKNRKHKHITLVWSGVIKTDDIQNIKKEGEIIKEYKLVTSRLRLPKKAIRHLIVDFNEFLYSPKKPFPPSELFEILRQPYALDIVKYFSENEEMTIKEFREITKLGRDKSLNCLNSFEKLGLLKSYRYGRNGRKNYGITLEKERIAKIMNILSNN